MRIFDYYKIQRGLLNSEIVQMMADIYEHKEKPELFIRANV